MIFSSLASLAHLALLGVLPLPLAPTGPAEIPAQQPTVAILVYEGVQIIDFTVPFEVFGQFGRNQVFTVARDSTPITTYMGMRIVPDHVLGSHPPVDVLVLPGGAGTSDAAADPVVRSWIDRTVAEADHVLTTCTGIFLLVDGGHLAGRTVTTWYGRQDDLRSAVPDATVVEDEIVVEDGKFVTSAGTGLEGALRVVSLLHGESWAGLIRLNMEYEPMPAHLHVPRVHLADLRLPESIYAHFPWREADFLVFEGDTDSWEMAWRFESDLALDTLSDRLTTSLGERDGWREIRVEVEPDARIVTGRLPEADRTEGRAPWFGRMELSRAREAAYALTVRVERLHGSDACTGTDPAWSPDGLWLAYVEWCGEEADLYRIRPDGTARTRLGRTPGREHTPAWSPDGRRIAYSYHPPGGVAEIWTTGADGSNPERWTDDGYARIGPTWSPDGSRIAYESRRDGNSDLYVLDLETREEVRLTSDGARDVAPAWSPDGSTIAFQSDRGGPYGIWGIDPGGGPPRPLYVPEVNVTTPDWSPDGRELVVAHHGDGRGELYRIPIDGGAAVRITRNERTDFWPRWSPDGRRIAFIVRDGEAWNVMVLDLESGEERRLTGVRTP